MLRIVIIGLGDNIHTIRWANALCNNNCEVTVLSSNLKLESPHKKDDRINFQTVFEYIGKPIPTNRIQRIIYYLKLRKRLLKNNYDIVQLHSFNPYSIFLASLPRCLISVWGKDIIWDYDKPESFFRKYIKRKIFKNVSYISATSKYLKKQVEKYNPKAVKYTRIIAFGVDLEQFIPKREKFSDNIIRIVFTKHLLPKYGPLLLVKAFINLSKKYNNIELIIVGQGKQENEIRKVIKENSLQNQIKLVGQIAHQEIIQTLDDCDIFVMPSVYNSESFGVSAIEASAMELPIIVTNVGGVPEVINNNETGLLIQPNSVKAIELAIERMINNKKRAVQFGKNGRDFVIENYDWNNNVKEMVDYYKLICQN